MPAIKRVEGDKKMSAISIVGYESDSKCEHCGRLLKHGIRISDGRVVGSTCLNEKMTQPKIYMGKKYRVGAEVIVTAAKVAELYPESQWGRFGVSSATLQFQSV